MKAWLKKHKSEIIVGLVVFAITSICSSVFNFITIITPSARKTFITSIEAIIYFQASHQSPSNFVSTFFTLLYSLVISLILIVVIKIISGIQAQAFLKKIQKAVEEYDNSEEGSDERKKAQDNVISIAKKVEGIEGFTDTIMSSKIIAFFIIVFSVWYIALFYCSFVKPAEIWSSFEQSITQIAPYVEESDVKVLRSKWISMKSKEDYEEIEEYIDSVKKMNDLKD